MQMQKTIAKDWTDKAAKNLVRRNFIHYGKLLFEWLLFLSLDLRKTRYYDTHFTVPNENLLNETQAQGKGAILVGGHVGVWESLGPWTGRFHGPVTVTVKHVNSPLFQRLREELQNTSGITLLDSRSGRRRAVELVQALRRGELAGIFMDQYRFSENFSRFFGQKARTNSTAAVLHRKTGAPLINIQVIRVKFGQYRIDMKKLTPPPQLPGMTDSDHVAAIVQYLNDILEEVIRAHPDQWLWAHRRFKDNPEFDYD